MAHGGWTKRTTSGYSPPAHCLLAHGAHILALFKLVHRWRMLTTHPIYLRLGSFVCIWVGGSRENKSGDCRGSCICAGFEPITNARSPP